MASHLNHIPARSARSLFVRLLHSLVIASLTLASMAAGGSVAIAAPGAAGTPGTPTATPTLTTPTASGTATESVTPTETLTSAPSTGTAPASETATAANSATPSETQSATATESATPLATATTTGTATESATPAHTPTATASETLSPTPSATPTTTETGTATATESPTGSETIVPASATPSPTASSTFVISLTATPTLTATATPTITVTPTQTVTATPTEEVFQISPDGGQVAPADGILTVDFPAGAVSQTVLVHYQDLATGPGAPANLQNMIYAFELDASAVATGQIVSKFAKVLTITVDLAKEGVSPGSIDSRQLVLGYYDVVAGQWVDIPYNLYQDRESGIATATFQVDHFTDFGFSADETPGWALKFNEPGVDLSTGAASYDYKIDLPAGRNGLTPPFSLSYNSKAVQNVNGYFQADWAGDGWQTGPGEIVQQLGQWNQWAQNSKEGGACSGIYTLNLNGAAYKLTTDGTGRYWTMVNSGMYVQYYASGGSNGPYWQVWDPSGTIYRFGYNSDSSQKISCNPNSDSTVGIFRWRLDKVIDTLGNQIKYTYTKEQRNSSINGQACNPPSNGGFDRASYLSQIQYDNLDHNNPVTNWGYTVVFNLSTRSGDSPVCGELFGQDKYLTSIVMKNSSSQKFLEYDLSTSTKTESERTGLNPQGTPLRELDSVTEKGYDPNNNNNVITYPVTSFAYTMEPGWLPFSQPGCQTAGVNACYHVYFWILATISNGYGATTSFTYADDSAAHNPSSGYSQNGAGGYSYSVSKKQITALPGWQAAEWDYNYSHPCYDDFQILSSGIITPTGELCWTPPQNKLYFTTLTSFQTVTVTQIDYYGAVLSVSVHNFDVGDPNCWYKDTGPTRCGYSVNKLVGRETSSYTYDAGMNLQKKQVSSWSYTEITPPTEDAYYARWAAHLDSQTNSDCDYGGVDPSNTCQDQKTNYYYDSYENITETLEYSDLGSIPFRYINTEYAPQTVTATNWIVDKPARIRTYNWTGSAWNLVSVVRHQYDSQTASQYLNPPTVGRPSWNRTCFSVGGGSCNSNSWSDVNYGYDATWPGNQTTQTTYTGVGDDAVWASTGPQTTTVTYESTLHQYPSSMVNALNRTVTANYDLNWGVPLVVTDTNGNATSYTHDYLGRPTSVVKPGDSPSSPTITYYYNDTSGFTPPLMIETDQLIPEICGSCYVVTYKFYDGLGQLVQQRAEADGTHQNVTSYGYDTRGLVISTSVPISTAWSSSYVAPTWSSTDKSTIKYDALGRVLTSTATDGTLTQHLYGVTPEGSLIATYDDVMDANRHRTQTRYDPLGRSIAVYEIDGNCASWYIGYTCGGAYTTHWVVSGTTRYNYDVLNNLTWVSDTLANTTVVTYDARGLKTGMLDPDMGNWGYGYDGAGNLTTQTDSRGCVITFSHDPLNRLTGKSYSGACSDPAVTYTYDAYDATSGQYGRGHRTGMADASGSTTWKYDSRGRVISTTQIISGVTGQFTTNDTYDPLDRVTSIAYPNGEVVTQTYNTAGQLDNLRSQSYGQWYAGNLDYNANGSLARLDFGNGLSTLYGYFGLTGNQWDARPGLGLTAYGRLWRSRTEAPGGQPLQDWRYTYDGVGNVTSIYDVPRAITPTVGSTWSDDFSAKKTADWTYTTQSLVLDNGNSVVQNVGTGSSWLDFPRQGTIGTGSGVQVQFKVIAATANFVLGLQTDDASPLRLAIVGNGTGALKVQYNDGLGWRYPLGQTPTIAAGDWYTLTLLIDDTRGNTLELYNSASANARLVYNIGSVAGKQWRFHAWTWTGTLELDNYREFGSGTGYAPSEQLNFQYDALDRLTAVVTNTTILGGYTGAYGYNLVGNLLSKTENGASLNYTYGAQSGTCPNGALTKAHAVVTAGANTYCYDPNGNMNQRVENGGTYTQNFDAENRLISVTGPATATYKYDGDGNLVKKSDISGTTVYLGQSFEVAFAPGASLSFAPQATTLTNTLTSYWKLEEASGNRADAAGSNALTANNAVGQAGGKIGSAAQFSAASSQSLSHTNNASLSTGNIDFTLAAWVYLSDKSADRVIVSKWNKDNNQREYLLQYASAADRFNFGVSNDGTTIGSLNADAFGSPVTSAWYFVVAWHDSVANTLNIQVNNGAVSSLAWSSGVLPGTADFAIGARRDSLPNYFDGRIDEVGLWKRVLSASERTSLYNSGAGCQYPFSACPAGVSVPGAGQTWRVYYSAGLQRIAERELTGAGTNTLYFLHGDHLGSTSLVTCGSASCGAFTMGQVVDRQYYYPYGGTRSGGAQIPTDFRYTGQRAQASIGLYYFGARFYDGVVGRFLSADTIVPGAGNPQALNRFSYVLNNPINHTDPTGHECGDPACAAAAAQEPCLEEGICNPGSLNPTSLTEFGVGFVIGSEVFGFLGDVASSLFDMFSPSEVTGYSVAADTAAGTAQSEIGPSTQLAAPESYCSFSGDTLVATANGEQPIDTIAVGDRVVAYNQQLGSTGYYTVTATWVHVDAVIVALQLDGEQIETTLEHPFFTAELGWTPAGSLWQGAHIRRADGSYGRLLALIINRHLQAMYNLTVALAHTYFVGDRQWLAHNTCYKYQNGQTSEAGPEDPGYRLAQTAKDLYRPLGRSTGNATIAIGQTDSGQLTFPVINNEAGATSAGQAGAIQSPYSVPPESHAESYLDELYGNQVVRVAISNRNGPCPLCAELYASPDMPPIYYEHRYISFK